MTPFEKAARAHAESRAAEGTRALYLADLNNWLTFCDGDGINPAKPTLAGAAAWRDTLNERLAPLTVRRTIAALSAMYDAAITQETPAATWNPFKKLPRPPATEYSKTEIFTTEEATAIIAEAEKTAVDLTQGVRDVAILRLLYDTGLRISAVVTLRRSKVIRRGASVVVRVRTKGNKEVDVELPPIAAEALQRWLSRGVTVGDFVFPARGGRRALTRAAINRRLKFYGKAAGVEHVHPHRFRATFITDALDVMKPNEVQAAVHHASMDTTQRYDRRQRGAGVTAAVAAARAKSPTGK